MKEISRRLMVGVVCVSVAVMMFATSVAGQAEQEQEGEQNQLETWERAELESLVEVVRAALLGQLTPTEDPFELTPDFLKGTGGNTYVPFTVEIDPAKVGEGTVAVYIFVAAHQEPSTASEPEPEPEPEEPQLPPSVFEAAYFIDVSAQRSEGEQVQVSRSFTAQGGDYDIYIAIRDSKGAPAVEGEEPEAASVMMLKDEVSVPNLWTTDLRTSSVIVAKAVEPLSQPLTPEEQVENPYTLGTTRITPKISRSFSKQEELSLLMLVYNPRLTAEQKPDVTVEYNFHQRTDSGEEFFNKTNPQQFNAQTLPPGFDLAQGHQVVAGQAVPLAAFPPGDYRVEIIVTDNAAGTSLTREVNFTVRET